MLANSLLSAGLLQFGRFSNNGGWQPYRLNLELLPSYPDILSQIVDISAPLVGRVDHLVCPQTALPFGVALCQKTGVPLVYSRGEDVLGAYDIGHPALLIANDLSEASELGHLITRARRVGLEIDRALVIMDLGWGTLNGVEAESLLHLPQVVETLMQEERLPAGQGRAVLDWISLHRPG